MTTYSAHVHREGKFWAIDVPGVGFTQAVRLTNVDAVAREMISLVTDEPEDQIDLNTDIVVPADAASHIEQARLLREEAERAQSGAAVESARSAAALKADGLTLREIGLVLRVSHQRAQQLLDTISDKGTNGPQLTRTDKRHHSE
jgi:hypothetical protein